MGVGCDNVLKLSARRSGGFQLLADKPDTSFGLFDVFSPVRSGRDRVHQLHTHRGVDVLDILLEACVAGLTEGLPRLAPPLFA